jgi:hypothetical protein
MADDVSLPGAGRIVAGDEIGGAIHQRMKLVHGIDGVSDGDVANSNPLPTRARPYTALVSGQKTGITTGAVPLAASSTPCGVVILQAASTNTAALLVGDAGGQHLELLPRETYEVAIDNVAKLYVKAASGTQVANFHYLA